MGEGDTKTAWRSQVNELQSALQVALILSFFGLHNSIVERVKQSVKNEHSAIALSCSHSALHLIGAGIDAAYLVCQYDRRLPRVGY